jgi:hypothetical protein
MAMATLLAVTYSGYLASHYLTNRGFNASTVVAAGVWMRLGDAPEPAAVGAALEGALAEIRSQPGIAGAAAATGLPFRIDRVDQLRSDDSASRQDVVITAVTDSFFSVLAIDHPRTRLSACGVDSVFVSRSVAEWLSGSTPSGMPLHVTGSRIEGNVCGITGDVRDAANPMLELGHVYEAFVPDDQEIVWIVAKTTRPVATVTRAVSAAVSRHMPWASIDTVAPLQSLLAAATGDVRLVTVTASLIAGAMSIVSLVAVFSAVARSVSARRFEIALRIAVGARLWRATASVMAADVAWPLGGLLLSFVAWFVLQERLAAALSGEVVRAPGWVGAVVVAVLAMGVVVSGALAGTRTARMEPREVLSWQGR